MDKSLLIIGFIGMLLFSMSVGALLGLYDSYKEDFNEKETKER